MNFWNPLPLFRLLIPLILGVFCSIFLSVDSEIFTPLLAFFFLLFLLMIFFKRTTNKYRNRWMFGFSVYLLLFAFSLFITAHYQNIDKENHFSNFESDYCIAKLSEDAIEKEKSVKIEVEVIAVQKDSFIQNTIGNAILYLEKDTNAINLQYGDQIVVKSNWKAIDGPTNPAQFDYKKFLANSDIFHHQFVDI